MSGEFEKQRCPRPKSASPLHPASKSSPYLRNLSSRKLAQAQFEKLTARKLPLWWRKDGARISARMNNFHSILIVVLNTAQLVPGCFVVVDGWIHGTQLGNVDH